jgi:hypothetical protein
LKKWNQKNKPGIVWWDWSREFWFESIDWFESKESIPESIPMELIRCEFWEMRRWGVVGWWR